jgi:hypothetical protein
MGCQVSLKLVIRSDTDTLIGVSSPFLTRITDNAFWGVKSPMSKTLAGMAETRLLEAVFEKGVLAGGYMAESLRRRFISSDEPVSMLLLHVLPCKHGELAAALAVRTTKRYSAGQFGSPLAGRSPPRISGLTIDLGELLNQAEALSQKRRRRVWSYPTRQNALSLFAWIPSSRRTSPGLKITAMMMLTISGKLRVETRNHCPQFPGVQPGTAGPH